MTIFQLGDFCVSTLTFRNAHFKETPVIPAWIHLHGSKIWHCHLHSKFSPVVQIQPPLTSEQNIYSSEDIVGHVKDARATLGPQPVALSSAEKNRNLTTSWPNWNVHNCDNVHRVRAANWLPRQRQWLLQQLACSSAGWQSLQKQIAAGSALSLGSLMCSGSVAALIVHSLPSQTAQYCVCIKIFI